MSNVPWSFSDFVRWLRAESEMLRKSGSKIEFQVNETSRASVRLRVERGQRLGELTVWDDGSAHMAVLDLASGEFIFERDAVSFANASLSKELIEFFKQLNIKM